jgi:hypothetical protein
MYQYVAYSIRNIWGCAIFAHITSTHMSNRTGNRTQHQTHTIVTTATEVFVPSIHNLFSFSREHQCSVCAFTIAAHHQNRIPLLLLHGPGHEDGEFSCPKLLSTASSPEITENVLPIHHSAQTSSVIYTSVYQWRITQRKTYHTRWWDESIGALAGENNVPWFCLSRNGKWGVLPEQMTLLV